MTLERGMKCRSSFFELNEPCAPDSAEDGQLNEHKHKQWINKKNRVVCFVGKLTARLS